MPHVTFERPYNHTWPSRAVTAYPAGWSGVVKREVAEAAVPDFARKSRPAPAGANGVADGDVSG